MAEVLLYHHVLGLTPGVLEFAEVLRHAGHTVHTPDLFAGRTFEDIDVGMRFLRELGFGEVMARGDEAVAGLPGELVYAGFSMGVGPAQKLVQTRPGARGALFFHGSLPASEFDAPWPKGVPVQIHAMDSDPFFVDGGDLDAARALVQQAEAGELFLYPGKAHLFTDSSRSEYDPDATRLVLERALKFLADR
jgi:dienelactone hydrolase